MHTGRLRKSDDVYNYLGSLTPQNCIALIDETNRTN